MPGMRGSSGGAEKGRLFPEFPISQQNHLLTSERGGRPLRHILFILLRFLAIVTYRNQLSSTEASLPVRSGCSLQRRSLFGELLRHGSLGPCRGDQGAAAVR